MLGCIKIVCLISALAISSVSCCRACNNSCGAMPNFRPRSHCANTLAVQRIRMPALNTGTCFRKLQISTIDIHTMTYSAFKVKTMETHTCLSGVALVEQILVTNTGTQPLSGLPSPQNSHIELDPSSKKNASASCDKRENQQPQHLNS